MKEKRLSKSLSEYEIIVPIENLKLGKHEYEISGIKLFEMSSEFADQWGINKVNKIYEKFYEDTISKAVAFFTENAVDLDKAAAMARNEVNTLLDILRVSLLIDHEPRIIGWKIHDEQMLFTKSEFLYIRKGETTSGTHLDWKRSFRSVEFEVNDDFTKQLETSKPIVGSILNDISTEKFRNRYKRAMHWISSSITKDELDYKIVDICAALETLLSRQSDGKKGECIALRMQLLNIKLKKTAFDPKYLIDIYNKRSKIIHGSSLNVCTEFDYQTGRTIALDILTKILSYIRLHGIKKFDDFLNSLSDDKELLYKAVEFWKNTSYYRRIKEAADSM